MSTPHYQDESVTLWHGDALDVLSSLPDASVDCCITSPPYYGLRDYGGQMGQLGQEAEAEEYVEALAAVMREVARVVANDGTIWLNLGDSYDQRKSLMGVPWEVALRLRNGGLLLRNEVIWAKPNAMPESVTDRLSTRHEHFFMFAKKRDYWFDLDPIREPHVSEPGREGANYMRGQKAIRPVGPNSGAYSEGGRNPGDVWDIAVRLFMDAHFATMPLPLAERAVVSGCKPGGTVLDPFSGSGTTGLAATKHGRRYVGIDLSADYLNLSLRTRFAQPGLNLDGGAA
jgi:DNA modification methylase